MTITQRSKIGPREDDQLNLTSGIQYNCDWCHQDITHTVRIKCAADDCAEVDMCPSCFCKGREGGKHKAWHDYRVVEQHSYPIFDEAWGADEELLLIEGLTLFGLGNWQDAAEHVGTRTKDECEAHYRQVWIGEGGEAEGSGPKMESSLGYRDDIKFEIDTDTFQQRKKRRIEDMRAQTREIPSGSTKKPLVSAPVNHEIGGFMPGRLDFEHEVYMDDAEEKVKDMEFGLVMAYGGDEQPEEAAAPPPPPATAEPTGDSAPASTADDSPAPLPPPPPPPPPPPLPSATDSAAGTPVAQPSPTKMDVDDDAEDADPDDDDDDDDFFSSAPSAAKQPPPSSSSASGAAPMPGQSHRGLSSTAGKQAASNKASAAGAVAAAGAGAGGASKKTMHPPSSLPKHILAQQQRDRSVSDSATPEPEGDGSAPSSPATSTAADQTVPSGSKTLPPTPASGASSLPSSSAQPKPPASAAPTTAAAVQPLNLVTDSADYPEDPDDLELKLAVLRIYNERLDRRREVKNIIFQRGLTEHKKIVALDRKRPQKERDLIQKHKVFAKLQTAEDYEVLIDGLVYEQTLRARIAQLQTYRSKGISTILDAERYEAQLELRASGIADVKVARGGNTGAGGSAAAAAAAAAAVAVHGKRTSAGPEDHLSAAVRNQYTAATGSRKPPQPLNLASAASLHLLTPNEQALCSTLRILPKPYLMIKETLIREYVRRNGQLRRREARSLIKVDVNKTSKIWDLMAEMGCFTLGPQPSPTPTPLGEAPPPLDQPVQPGDGVAKREGEGEVDPALLAMDVEPVGVEITPAPDEKEGKGQGAALDQSALPLETTLPAANEGPPPVQAPPPADGEPTPMEGVVKTEDGE